jgi:hypothetical protein
MTHQEKKSIWHMGNFIVNACWIHEVLVPITGHVNQEPVFFFLSITSYS